MVSRTHLRVSGFHKLVFGIPEHDLDIHTMVLDTHMRVPDIRKSRDDNFWLAFSSSPQFELKMHKVADHKATAKMLPMRRTLRMPIAIPGAMVAIMGGTVVVVMGAGSGVTAMGPIPGSTAIPPPVLITCWRRSGAKFAMSGAILAISGAREVTKLRALEISSNKGEE